MQEVLSLILTMQQEGYPAQVILDALRLRAEAEQRDRDAAMSEWEAREAGRSEATVAPF